MRPYLLILAVLALAALSTVVVVRLRMHEIRSGVSPTFVVGVAAFNVALYGLLVLLIP